ncbi:MAG: serine/threonine-protein kinase [Bryobacteraceae bacterium]
MTPAQFRRIRELYETAVEMPAAAREILLSEFPEEDAAEVRRLLAAREHPAAFFEQPVPVVPEAPTASIAGQTLGPYRLEREIGRGGMSVVYLGSHGEERVAIKVLDFPVVEFRKRLAREREILARLDHPNIVHVLAEGATERGCPYLVTQYVEGERIDRHCYRHQPPLRERLRLFCDVGKAVNFAHSHMVVHRDLKPANILVDLRGEVKLLDFGIAKVLHESAGGRPDTLTASGMMTPSHASPEQVRGEPITKTADVYSLGVLLYELLTEQSPYRVPHDSLVDMLRAVCEQEPLRPSAVLSESPVSGVPARLVRGEIDRIVIRAMHKEPGRRFPDAGAMVDELQKAI